jgi:O-antigen/teichoic acid export membrane protein
LCALIAVLIVARTLGSSRFGGYSAVMATIVVFQGFATLGMGVAVSKLIAALRTTDAAAARRHATLALKLATVAAVGLSVILLAVAPWLASQVLTESSLTTPLRISVVIMFFAALGGAQAGILSGLEAFRGLSLVSVTRGMVGAIATVAGATIAGLNGAIAGLAVGEMAATALGQVQLRREFGYLGMGSVGRATPAERSALIRLTLPVLVAGAAIAISLWGSQVLLARQPNGIRELGYYGLAYRWHLLVMFAPGAVAPVMLPIFVNMHSQTDHLGFDRLWRINLVGTLGVVVPSAAIVGLVSPRLVSAAGPSFGGAVPVLIILVAAAIPTALNNVLSQAALGLDRVGEWLVSDLVLAAVLFGAAVLLVPRFGAAGLGLAYLAGMVATCVALLPTVYGSGRGGVRPTPGAR